MCHGDGVELYLISNGRKCEVGFVNHHYRERIKLENFCKQTNLVVPLTIAKKKLKAVLQET